MALRLFASVDEHGDVRVPVWRWKLIKRWHNLRCADCRPLYRFWSVTPKRPTDAARIH